MVSDTLIFERTVTIWVCFTVGLNAFTSLYFQYEHTPGMKPPRRHIRQYLHNLSLEKPLWRPGRETSTAILTRATYLNDAR